MNVKLLSISNGNANIHWRTTYPRYDEFDWNYYNDCIDRLIAKTKKGTLTSLTVVHKKRKSHYAQAIETINSMSQTTRNESMAIYIEPFEAENPIDQESFISDTSETDIAGKLNKVIQNDL